MDRLKSKPVVLIADANPEHTGVLQAILAPEYDIKFAVDRDKAIRLASPPDEPALILLNDPLPGADALEVLRDLKTGDFTKDIPVIILSEPTPVDTEAKGFELGAADYITRPFKKSVVRARIRTQLELTGYRDKLESSVREQVNDLHEEIQERRDVEDTYRALVEHAKDGIAIIHDFIVKYANPAFCRMIGFSEDELIGAHLKKFISEEEFIKNTTRYSGRIKGLNLPRIYQSRVIHSDGSTFDVELNVSVVPYGKSLAALVFIRDMREEQEWQYCI